MMSGMDGLDGTERVPILRRWEKVGKIPEIMWYFPFKPIF